MQETRDNFNKLNHRDEKNNFKFFYSKLFSPYSPELCNSDLKVLEAPFNWLVKHRFQQMVPFIVDLKDFHEVSLVMSWLSIRRFICIVITTSDHQCIALALIFNLA